MLKNLQFLCMFMFCTFVICRGNPIADPQINQLLSESDFQPKEALDTNSAKIQTLLSLLNETVLQETLSTFSVPTNLHKEQTQTEHWKQAEVASLDILNVQSSTERLFTSIPNFKVDDEDNIKSEESRISPQKLKPSGIVTKAEDLKQEQAGSLNVFGVQSSTERLFTSKPNLEAGKEDNIQLNDLIITPQKIKPPPLLTETEVALNDLQIENSPELIKGQVTEHTETITQNSSNQTLSSLEYQFQRPSFPSAPGGLGGHLSQLIPSSYPWLASLPKKNITLPEHLKETSTVCVPELQSQKSTTKSPLEYQSKRPPFASAPGGISGGHLGPLIPSGNPWPANPPQQNITLEDRFKETTIATVQVLPTQKLTTKSPLEYQSHRPSFVSAPGGISGGHLGQLIPSGKPWPANPPKKNITLEDRFKETTVATVQVLPSQIPTTKSPLEYQSHRPSFASPPGGISGGHLGQLIPSGTPWPANPPKKNITLEDRFKETTVAAVQALPSQKPTTKSPLEYQSHRPSFASPPGGISGGHLGQLIPSGTPWPANPPKKNITLEDRFKETTVATVQVLPSQIPTTKSPLEYQSHRPSFASPPGGISGGHLGPLIPPGNPWPADPPQQNITLEDRLKETTTTVQALPSQKPTTKSPLEYQSHRPSYASAPGGISGGHLGPLIPPGNPWPADPPQQNITLEDRLKETTTTVQALPSQKPTTKSPLEYQSHRPSYASAPGGISGGHLGPLIPPGNPWPADPPQQNITLEDRLKETTITVQALPSQKPTTKSPLEYQSHRPSYASAPGGISGGHLGPLIPPGNPWPADPPQQNITLEDRLKETTTTVQALPSQKPTTKSPLEYQSHRPSFATPPGGIPGGHLDPIFPPGNPWPADPPKQNIILEDRLKETTTTVQALPSQKPTAKSSLEYQTRRPFYASAPGGISGGDLGQLIPSGNPWPAGPPEQNIMN